MNGVSTADMAPVAGTAPWLDVWVGHARPGARTMVGPCDSTLDVYPELGPRVRALVGAGLIVAVWKKLRAGDGHVWEWHMVRTHRPLPVAWPSVLAHRAVPPPCGAPVQIRGVRVPDVETVWQMIVAAARIGAAAPSNREIADRCGFSSFGHGSRLVDSLERQGRIAVERSGPFRVIHIPSLGISTGSRR